MRSKTKMSEGGLAKRLWSRRVTPAGPPTRCAACWPLSRIVEHAPGGRFASGTAEHCIYLNVWKQYQPVIHGHNSPVFGRMTGHDPLRRVAHLHSWSAAEHKADEWTRGEVGHTILKS